MKHTQEQILSSSCACQHFGRDMGTDFSDQLFSSAELRSALGSQRWRP